MEHVSTDQRLFIWGKGDEEMKEKCFNTAASLKATQSTGYSDFITPYLVDSLNLIIGINSFEHYSINIEPEKYYSPFFNDRISENFFDHCEFLYKFTFI